MSKLRITQARLGGGAVEIGIRDASNDLVAVITHPCKGAKWFLHGSEKWFRYGGGPGGSKKFKTKKAAMDAVISEIPLDA